MMSTESLFKLGWELTNKLGVNGVTWKVEDNDIEVWAGERYFVVTCPDADAFIVTEEDESNDDVMKDRKAWCAWDDAAYDLVKRIRHTPAPP